MNVQDCLTAIYFNLSSRQQLPKPLLIRLSQDVYDEYKDSLVALTRWTSEPTDDEHVRIMNQNTRLVFRDALVKADPKLANYEIIFEEATK